MNIVWLTPEIPYPPIGGRNGVFNRIVQMSKYNTIYLFSIAYSKEEKATSEEMRKYCADVKYYNRNESRIKKLLKSIFLPYSVASRTLPEIKMDMKKLFENTRIDVVIVDFPNMVNNLMDVIDGKQYCTLNQHNVEYLRMRNMFYVNTIPFYKRLAYFMESFRLEWYEQKIYKNHIFKSITFFSEDDLKIFEERWKGVVGDVKLKHFPLGANAARVPIQRVHNHTMLFVGRLDKIAIPNVEAAVWFVGKVLPMIVRKVPDVKLIIAGANPSEEVLALRSEYVKIIPNYESLESVYSLADIVLLPLLSGGGVKGKLLEAAAFGKIIITTKHGIEGTTFQHMEHVLLANSYEEFAERCISVLLNQSKYEKLSIHAKELFEKEYDWNMIGKHYNKFLNNEGTSLNEE